MIFFILLFLRILLEVTRRCYQLKFHLPYLIFLVKYIVSLKKLVIFFRESESLLEEGIDIFDWLYSFFAVLKFEVAVEVLRRLRDYVEAADTYGSQGSSKSLERLPSIAYPLEIGRYYEGHKAVKDHQVSLDQIFMTTFNVFRDYDIAAIVATNVLHS